MSMGGNVRNAMVFKTVRLVFISIPVSWFGLRCADLVTINRRTNVETHECVSSSEERRSDS